MNLKKLINKSVYGTVGYIESEADLDKLEQYILYNLPVLNEFNQIVVATNYKKYPHLSEKNAKLWKKYFNQSTTLDSKINRGHSFGTADLDNLLFSYCKKNNIEWMFKTSNDVIIEKSFMDKEIPNADFYYFNGISYEDLFLNGFDYKKVFYEHIFPQTNGYFINISKCDYLTDESFLNETYEYIKGIQGYNNKPWEYIKGWGCELFLKKCIERNGLSKHYLLNIEKHNQLCEIIKTNKIGDPSHKNIMIEGICHFHFSNELIIQI
jgi:hypothetical protein